MSTSTESVATGRPHLHSGARLGAFPFRRDSGPVPDAAATTYTGRHRQNRAQGGRAGHVIAGVLVSAGLHLGLVSFPGTPSARVVATAEPEAASVEITPMELPEPEPTLVDNAEAAPPESMQPSFAPPSQAELPGLVAVDAFVQVMQAPTPSGVNLGDTMALIPRGIATAQVVSKTQLFDVKELDRVPRRLRTVSPTYPAELKRARVEGEVVLLVEINQAGRVRVDRVVHATAKEFAASASAAAEQCQFETPLRGGAAVSARYEMRVPFRLSTTVAAQ